MVFSKKKFWLPNFMGMKDAKNKYYFESEISNKKFW